MNENKTGITTHTQEDLTTTPPADVSEIAFDETPKTNGNGTTNPNTDMHKKLKLVTAIVSVAIIGAFVGASALKIHQTSKPVDKTAASSISVVTTAPKTTVQQSTDTAQKAATATKVPGLKLDTKKNYGNKYADGLLPVGDSRYVTSGAKKGYVYECQANFVPAGQAGAQARGPWFTNNNTRWDSNKKSAIKGNVSWKQNMSTVLKDGTRTIITNDLPNHHTGVFPVAKDDPARVYDANPNTISEQSLTYALAGMPAYGTPQCMGGEVGIMTTGVALFNAFDAGGRDAGAWEVQDSCDGHPQNKGEYHYHSLSRCITDQSVSKVIGYALDGFPITGPKVGDKNYLTTDDLDECHGIVSSVLLDGKETMMYHYVMTQDFPYSVSCFRATPTQPPGRP